MLSCHSTYDITGTYSMLNNPHKFVINTDSTFNYFYTVMGDVEKYSFGTWKQIGKNRILLNSNIQSNIIPLDVHVVSSDNKNPMINLKLIIPGKDEKEYRCTPNYAFIGNYYIESFCRIEEVIVMKKQTTILIIMSYFTRYLKNLANLYRGEEK
jgi:hypothetical protein